MVENIELARALAKGVEIGRAIRPKWLQSRRRDFDGGVQAAGRVLGSDRRMFPHLLRHSFAVHLLLGGADIRHVQALLGHTSIDVTKVYLRLLPEQLRAEYEAAMPELL